MAVEADSLGRIAKLFIDRDNMSLEEAQKHLSGFRIVLRCGPEVARSATLQAAVLTAANVASRCFPGSIRVAGVANGPVMVRWPAGSTFRDAIAEICGGECLAPCDDSWDSANTV